MKNKELVKRIKNLRIRKGFSQEELAGKSGLSLRTVQRIENGETEPRGDSLKRLAAAFNVTPDEILDWDTYEDKGLLLGLNLSALSFLVFPLLGILVPLIIWVSKKDKIRNINDVAKSILNFQITWVMLLFGWYILIISSVFLRMKLMGEVSVGMFGSAFLNLFVIVFLYAYNIGMVIYNILQITNEKQVRYFPKIRFIRS